MIRIDKLKKSSKNTHKSIKRKARKTMQRTALENSKSKDQAHTYSMGESSPDRENTEKKSGNG